MEPVGLLGHWTHVALEFKQYQIALEQITQPDPAEQRVEKGRRAKTLETCREKGKASSSQSPQPSTDTSFTKEGRTQSRPVPLLFENKPRLLGDL